MVEYGVDVTIAAKYKNVAPVLITKKHIRISVPAKNIIPVTMISIM